MKRRNLEQIDVNVDLPFSDRRQQDCLHVKSERRKVRKVIVERKRRERIDRSLDQLKQFLIDHSSSNSPNHTLQVGDPCGPSNLEKADILELTVDHLRLLRTRTDQQRANGYNRCAREVDQFLRTSCPEGEMRRRLMAFLARRQPHQHSQSSLFGRQGYCSWSAEMSTSFDEQRLGTSLGMETMVTDSRTAFSVIRHPSLVNHVRQLSPVNRVQQPSPVNHVQSAVVDTTISEERRIESDDDLAAREDDDEKRQPSVTKSPRRMTVSPENSVCSLSAIVHDFSKSSVRLGKIDSTDGAVKGSNDEESVWRPW